ncbi:MAG TPA: bacteriohemerythrin [Candidatus Omnitrophota bacterium]|nr:bacteriohemerythrin [Candidatus Omnitrophota bacterium]
MGAITWSEMMSVGVPILDADHKTLVGLINDLHRSVGDDEEYATLGSVLKALADYADYHFAREERVMEACRYPALNSHIVAHHKLAQQVRELKDRYDADRTAVRAKDCLNFLNKWLIEHICSTDMDYRAYVGSNPAALAAAENVTMTGARPASRGGLDWKALRILVVDDNANFLQVMRTILEGVGVREIRTANDLDAAKAALGGMDFDLMVTDWHVGRQSGLDLVRWVRGQERLAKLPLVMLSGHERVSNRDIALDAGADEFMEKPISARGLLMCLARLMTRQEASA